MLFQQLFLGQFMRQQKNIQRNVGIDAKTKIIEILKTH